MRCTTREKYVRVMKLKFKVFAAECKRHSEALSGRKKLWLGIFNEFKQIALIAA